MSKEAFTLLVTTAGMRVLATILTICVTLPGGQVVDEPGADIYFIADEYDGQASVACIKESTAC